MIRHEKNDAVHAEGYVEERESKQRPFECQHCQMRFTMKQTLSRHLDGICKVLKKAKWEEEQRAREEKMQVAPGQLQDSQQEAIAAKQGGEGASGWSIEKLETESGQHLT